MSAQLSAPLIGGHSDDPFYAFRDELQLLVQRAGARFARWKTLLETCDTSSSAEFRDENDALGKELASIQSNVNDLEQVLQRVQTHRSNFAHISDTELASRQGFIREMKDEVGAMRATMKSAQTKGKLEQDKKQALMQRGRAQREEVEQTAARNADFIEDQQQQQQLHLQRQDEHLDELGQGATRLGHMAVAIGEEIEQQNRMLDDLHDDMGVASGRMEAMLGRMDKMLKSNSRCQTNTILALLAVAVILLILVAWT